MTKVILPCPYCVVRFEFGTNEPTPIRQNPEFVKFLTEFKDHVKECRSVDRVVNECGRHYLGMNGPAVNS